MFTNIEIKAHLTLGKLREIVNKDLSEFPDTHKIHMCIYTEDDEEPQAPICSIIADEEDINFYNY